jgi:fatty acid desaturase
MEHRIMRNPRVRSLKWRDLIKPSTRQIIIELLLIIPWFTASLACAHWADQFHLLFLIPALCFSFIFFLTALRVVHNAYHYALGLPKWITECIIFIFSVLMGWSLHAVQVNHLRHHKYCLGEGDTEAMSARMSALRAVLFGPLFPFLLLWHGMRYAKVKQRIWIVAEMTACLALAAISFLILDIAFLRYHVICMAVGECLTALFAVWTVHHDCDQDGIFARTSTGKWKNRLTFNMFLHLEHHLFPAVPTCNLHRLSKQLHAATPELRRLDVI